MLLCRRWNESCDEVCAANGASYHPATLAIIGSDAADRSQCSAALTALSTSGDLAAVLGKDPGVISVNSSDPMDTRELGCAVFNSTFLTLYTWYSSQPTTSGAKETDMHRVCSCDQ